MSRALYSLRAWSVEILLQHQKYHVVSADSVVKLSQDMQDLSRFLLLMIHQISSPPEETYIKRVVKHRSCLPREVVGVPSLSVFNRHLNNAFKNVPYNLLSHELVTVAVGLFQLKQSILLSSIQNNIKYFK